MRSEDSLNEPLERCLGILEADEHDVVDVEAQVCKESGLGSILRSQFNLVVPIKEF